MQPIFQFTFLRDKETLLNFPVTFSFLVLNVCFYTSPFYPKEKACLRLDEVLIFVSSMKHFDPTHISINMLILVLEGTWLERHLHGRRFFYLLFFFSVLSNLVFLLLEAFLHRIWPQTECVVGLSGVLFGLIVVKNHYDPDGMTHLGVVSVCNFYAVWVLLVFSCVVNPSSSLIGNLSGVLTGFLYTNGPLKTIIELCAACGAEPPQNSVPAQSCTPKPNVVSDRTQFVRKVSGPVLDQLLDKLLEDEVINNYEMEKLENFKNRAEKARAVFDSVKQKGDGAYSVLREALREMDPNAFESF